MLQGNTMYWFELDEGFRSSVCIYVVQSAFLQGVKLFIKILGCAPSYSSADTNSIGVILVALSLDNKLSDNFGCFACM